MQAGLHALNWTLQRLGIGLAIVAGLALLSLTLLVAIIVVAQGASGLGQ